MSDTAAIEHFPAARLRLFIVAALLLIAGGIPWVLPATLLPVYWTEGSPFELGPFAEGWSLTQEIETQSAGHVGFSFSARPEKQDGRSPTLEVRLEDGSQILWADQVRIDSNDMKRYTAEFPVAAAAGRYLVRIRVLETGQGGAVFRGANSPDDASSYVLNVMDAGQPDHLTLGFQVLQAGLRPGSWFIHRPPMSPVGWLIAFGMGALTAAPLLAGWSSDLRRRQSTAAALAISLSAACALAVYLIAVPIVQAGGFNLAEGSRLRSIASMAAFPLAFTLSYFLVGLESAARSNGSKNAWSRVLLVVAQIPLHWLRGWRLIGPLLWRGVFRWWRGTPLMLAVLSGILIAAGDYRTADILARSAVVSLIPAAFWPRRRRKTNSP